MKLSVIVVVLACALSAGVVSETDPLEQIKATMAGSACCRFEFISILESTVFDSVDSTLGSALIATDGRYHIVIGPDEYLKTTEYFYSYAGEQNQVTVEKAGTGTGADEAISFITRLDDYYSTRVISPGHCYFLVRRDTTLSSMPDSLTMYLTGRPRRLDRLEYFDLNEDLNRIVFLASEYQGECDRQALTPQFPDSAEVIKLY